MNWKHIIARSEHLLGGAAPSISLSQFGRLESIALESKVRKIAASTTHPFVSVLLSNFETSISVPSFFLKKSPKKLAGNLLIPLIGQYSHYCFQPSLDKPSVFLKEHRKMGEIYDTVAAALAIHRCIVEAPSEYAAISADLHSGNKLATLAADFLLASASLSLASFHKPKVVEIMSAAISDAVRADFSDFIAAAEDKLVGTGGSSSLSSKTSQWLNHIELRHGAMLGTSCEATILINSFNSSVDHLCVPAHRLGTTWACLCRLLDEYEFINKKLTRGEELTQTTIEPLTFPCFGFHQNGIPEPILADFTQILGYDTVFHLYSNAARHMCLDLESSLGDLLKVYVPGKGEEEKQLLVDAVQLLLKDCHSTVRRR